MYVHTVQKLSIIEPAGAQYVQPAGQKAENYTYNLSKFAILAHTFEY